MPWCLKKDFLRCDLFVRGKTAKEALDYLQVGKSSRVILVKLRRIIFDAFKKICKAMQKEDPVVV